MNLLEFENQTFTDLWNERTIKELNTYKPHKRSFKPIFRREDEHDLELYREFQQANFDEYFDWAGTYRYTLYK